MTQKVKEETIVGNYGEKELKLTKKGIVVPGPFWEFKSTDEAVEIFLHALGNNSTKPGTVVVYAKDKTQGVNGEFKVVDHTDLREALLEAAGKGGDSKKVSFELLKITVDKLKGVECVRGPGTPGKFRGLLIQIDPSKFDEKFSGEIIPTLTGMFEENGAFAQLEKDMTGFFMCKSIRPILNEALLCAKVAQLDSVEEALAHG